MLLPPGAYAKLTGPHRRPWTTEESLALAMLMPAAHAMSRGAFPGVSYAMPPPPPTTPRPTEATRPPQGPHPRRPHSIASVSAVTPISRHAAPNNDSAAVLLQAPRRSPSYTRPPPHGVTVATTRQTEQSTPSLRGSPTVKESDSAAREDGRWGPRRWLYRKGCSDSTARDDATPPRRAGLISPSQAGLPPSPPWAEAVSVETAAVVYGKPRTTAVLSDHPQESVGRCEVDGNGSVVEMRDGAAHTDEGRSPLVRPQWGWLQTPMVTPLAGEVGGLQNPRPHHRHSSDGRWYYSVSSTTMNLGATEGTEVVAPTPRSSSRQNWMAMVSIPRDGLDSHRAPRALSPDTPATDAARRYSRPSPLPVHDDQSRQQQSRTPSINSPHFCAVHVHPRQDTQSYAPGGGTSGEGSHAGSPAPCSCQDRAGTDDTSLPSPITTTSELSPPLGEGSRSPVAPCSSCTQPRRCHFPESNPLGSHPPRTGQESSPADTTPCITGPPDNALGDSINDGSGHGVPAVPAGLANTPRTARSPVATATRVASGGGLDMRRSPREQSLLCEAVTPTPRESLRCPLFNLYPTVVWRSCPNEAHAHTARCRPEEGRRDDVGTGAVGRCGSAVPFQECAAASAGARGYLERHRSYVTEESLAAGKGDQDMSDRRPTTLLDRALGRGVDGPPGRMSSSFLVSNILQHPYAVRGATPSDSPQRPATSSSPVRGQSTASCASWQYYAAVMGNQCSRLARLSWAPVKHSRYSARSFVQDGSFQRHSSSSQGPPPGTQPSRESQIPSYVSCGTPRSTQRAVKRHSGPVAGGRGLPRDYSAGRSSSDVGSCQSPAYRGPSARLSGGVALTFSEDDDDDDNPSMGALLGERRRRGGHDHGGGALSPLRLSSLLGDMSQHLGDPATADAVDAEMSFWHYLQDVVTTPYEARPSSSAQAWRCRTLDHLFQCVSLQQHHRQPRGDSHSIPHETCHGGGDTGIAASCRSASLFSYSGSYRTSRSLGGGPDEVEPPSQGEGTVAAAMATVYGPPPTRRAGARLDAPRHNSEWPTGGGCADSTPADGSPRGGPPSSRWAPSPSVARGTSGSSTMLALDSRATPMERPFYGSEERPNNGDAFGVTDAHHTTALETSFRHPYNVRPLPSTGRCASASSSQRDARSPWRPAAPHEPQQQSAPYLTPKKMGESL